SPHETMATNFLEGRGLTYDMKINDRLTITRYYEDELVYPLLCGIVYSLTKHNTAVLLFVQVVYTSLIPVFVYGLAKLLFDVRVARLSAVLSALSPGIIVYAASKIHSMTFYSLVFCVALFAAAAYMKKQDHVRAVFLGAMLGLAFLSRNNFVVFIPFLFLYLFLKKSLNLSGLAKISAAALLVLLPLVIRNYMVYQKVVILKPAVIWPAMNPKASGTLYSQDGSDAFTDVNRLFANDTRLTDLEYASSINKAVYENIRNNKLGYLVLCLKRFYYFWWFSPDTGREYAGYYLTLYKPYYALMLAFALCGIVFLAFQKHPAASPHWLLLILFILSTTLPHYLYYGEGRHRFALEPLLVIFTSYGLLHGYQLFRGLLRRSL
ncbi:MAG: glycosyltransferase family 39 protein, partial [Candidatus Omnitrophota bacterium]